jgi:hypothetical protein
MVQGSRLLNDNGSVIGLNVFDLIGAVGVLVLTGEGLRPIGLEALAVPAAVACLTALIPIRLKYRRKIVRDTLLYILRTGVLHDPARTSRTLAR